MRYARPGSSRGAMFENQFPGWQRLTARLALRLISCSKNSSFFTAGNVGISSSTWIPIAVI